MRGAATSALVIVHEKILDGCPGQPKVVAGSIRDVNLGLDLEVFEHLFLSSVGDLGAVIVFKAAGPIDKTLLDLAAIFSNSATHVTAIGHATDREVARIGGIDFERLDFGFIDIATIERGFDLEIVRSQIWVI